MIAKYISHRKTRSYCDDQKSIRVVMADILLSTIGLTLMLTICSMFNITTRIPFRPSDAIKKVKS